VELERKENQERLMTIIQKVPKSGYLLMCVKLIVKLSRDILNGLSGS